MKIWTTEMLEARSIPEPNTGCWLWLGAIHRSGYGHIRIRDRLVSAHRVAYEAATGTNPGALFVCHRCDNPPCVNPAHLFLGTAADNNRDMVSKGRQRYPSGEASQKNKLTLADVVGIRREYATGVVSLRDVAGRHGVSIKTIHKIVRGEMWRGQC